MTYKKYRCCFTDGNDQVLRTEAIEGVDDASAVLQVEQLLAKSPHHSAELWDGQRLVGRWAAATRARRNRPDLASSPAE
jgi:hypothetical protein